MNSKLYLFLSGFVIKLTLADFINLETSIDPEILNQNQVFVNRKERFIKFDTKDNELESTYLPITILVLIQSLTTISGLEIELGISIPFIKVPLTTGRQINGVGSENKISINAPGLIVAGMLMLTSFLIIPLLFNSGSETGFGFQRKAEERSLWPSMKDINEVLLKNGIDSSSCMQKSICWVTKTSKGGEEGSIGNWVNYFLNTWWLNRLIGGTKVEEAVETAKGDGNCDLRYADCTVSNERIHSFVKSVLRGSN